MNFEAKHLHPDLRHILTQDTKTRVHAMRQDRWVSYPEADEALALLDDLLAFPKKDRMPCLIIWGETNNGKTSVIKRFFRLNLPDDNPKGYAIHYPVLYMQLPEKPDLRSFYSDILKKMGADFRPSTQIGNLRGQAIGYLEDCDVRMIIIDELHNALRSGPNTQEAIFVMLRYLVGELSIPIVCSGLSKAVIALQADTQLENRFETFHLPYWENGREFRKFLHNYSKVIPLAEDSKLATTGLADLIFKSTNGTVGEFVTLLQKSAVAAVRNGQERIDEFAIKNSGYIHPDIRRQRIVDASNQEKRTRSNRALLAKKRPDEQ